jgi:hypothetical protein
MSAAKGSGIEPVETLGSPVTGSKPAKGSESHERCRRQARACEQRRPGRVSERLAGSGTPGEEAPRRMTRGGQRIARLLKSEVVRGTVRAKKRIVLADQRCPVPFSRRFQAACQKTSLNEKAISSRSPPIGLPRPTFASAQNRKDDARLKFNGPTSKRDDPGQWQSRKFATRPQSAVGTRTS